MGPTERSLQTCGLDIGECARVHCVDRDATFFVCMCLWCVCKLHSPTPSCKLLYGTNLSGVGIFVPSARVPGQARLRLALGGSAALRARRERDGARWARPSLVAGRGAASRPAPGAGPGAGAVCDVRARRRMRAAPGLAPGGSPPPARDGEPAAPPGPARGSGGANGVATPTRAHDRRDRRHTSSAWREPRSVERDGYPPRPPARARGASPQSEPRQLTSCGPSVPRTRDC